jgi:class 3 adenylate cyclase
MGLGLTDGLVMLGFIGSEQRVFYDVIGSNVNMAARFCAEAGANELLMSEAVMRSSGLDAGVFKQLTLNVKGIGQAVPCFHYSIQENPA